MSLPSRSLLTGPYRELQDKLLRAGEDSVARLRLMADYHFARHPQIATEMRQGASELRRALAEIEELKTSLEEARRWLKAAPKL